MTGSVIKELSATSSGSAEVRAVFEEAKNLLQLTGKRTVLFVGMSINTAGRSAYRQLDLDEIQRFNKAQQVHYGSLRFTICHILMLLQDIFLPYVERGLIQLIAATTENPSFKVGVCSHMICLILTVSSQVVGALMSRCRCARCVICDFDVLMHPTDQGYWSWNV